MGNEASSHKGIHISGIGAQLQVGHVCTHFGALGIGLIAQHHSISAGQGGVGLIIAGALCAYSLGANNIANIIGVFADSAPFKPVQIGKYFHLSGLQILFLLGGISISAGIVTYSKKVILTVGNNLMRMTPILALVVVLAQALTLFLFSSQGLQNFLINHNLPTFPLVPVSSTQAVIGAIIGLGLLKGGRGINWNITLKIILGWITTPIITMIICFISLFFLQNVFNMTVYIP